ncbi:MAG: class I SAM-dependent methyltransferase [Ilumatobacteraceae bacterium]
MANDQMRHHWTSVNGPAWVEHQRLFDRMLSGVTGHLLDAITVEHGQRIADIGCGTGTLTGAIADRGAHAVGIDISETMVGGARRRFPDLEFVVADAQLDPLPGPFDQVVSRFGVMFFDDPVAAFANIGTATTDGATMTFLCWRGIAENPAISAGARKLIAALPEAPPPMDPTAPGPMAFADPARLRGILIDAGWDAIDIEPVDSVARYDLDDGDDGIDGRMTLMLDSDAGRRFLADVPEAERGPGMAAARADIESFLVDGHVELPAACWLVRARR